jgi:hypothetical protein
MHMTNLDFVKDALYRFRRDYGESPVRMEFSPQMWAHICMEVELWMVRCRPDTGDSLCGVSVVVARDVVPRFVAAFGQIVEM